MPTFTDNAGRAWTVGLTVGHLAPLRELCGLDVARAARHQEDFDAIFRMEPEQLVAALYRLCEPQVERAGLTPEDWAHAFDGPAVESGTVALAEAVLDFFPRREIARALRGNLLTALALTDLAVTTSLAEAARGWSASAGSSPASSGSTPGP